jgi:hypothetical protein
MLDLDRIVFLIGHLTSIMSSEHNGNSETPGRYPRGACNTTPF